MAWQRILITGAAGNLGKVLRRELADEAPVLRLSDRDDLGAAAAHEELVPCDLADAEAVSSLLEDVDAVVHLGGQSVEASWDTVIRSNLIGAVNLWEAARKAGTKRIVFASSNHAIGMHPRTRQLDHTSPSRPDSRYGVSKTFTENLASLYADKHGIACMCMRIGSCFERPRDARMLSTWLSFRDFAALVRVGLRADYVYEIVYGVSANPESWWDNANAERLGYRPLDSAEAFRQEVERKSSGDPVAEALQGGSFAADEFTGDLERLL